MTRLLAWLAGTLLVLGLAAGGLLLLALDSKPLVERGETISQAAVNQARWLFLTNDPRRLQAGEARRTVIPAALVDEGINYLAGRSLRGRFRRACLKRYWRPPCRLAGMLRNGRWPARPCAICALSRRVSALS